MLAGGTVCAAPFDVQGFHGQAITLPRAEADRPDPMRLELRFQDFQEAAA